MGGADGEARELFDAVCVRSAAGRKPDLERAEQGLPELQRHDGRGSTSVDGDHADLLGDRVRGSGQLGVGHDRAVGAGDSERPVTETPDECRVAAGGDRREAGDPRRSPVVGDSCGERIARDVECAAVPRRDAVLEP